jgi:hypothetical protein
MNQTRDESPRQPATVRAEALIDNLGQRISQLTSLTAQRIQHATTSIREEADNLDQPDTSSKEKPESPSSTRAEESGKPATERAGELVDQMGHRIGYLAFLTIAQLQKAAARGREEVEDMWAEAQNIRRERDHDGSHASED